MHNRSQPAEERQEFRFKFGFALIQRGGECPYLVYYRVRDHLRRMGLGRRGLLELEGRYPQLTLRTSEGIEKFIPGADPHELEQLWASIKASKFRPESAATQ